MRTSVARYEAANVIHGNIYPDISLLPMAGNHESCSANSRISSVPSQNAGMEERISAPVSVTLSSSEYCFTAERMPTGMPMATTNTIAPSARRTVVKSRATISLSTGRFVRQEVPKSPCRALTI